MATDGFFGKLYDNVHEAASEVGSAVVELFTGREVTSEREAEILLAEAEARAAEAAAEAGMTEEQARRTGALVRGQLKGRLRGVGPMGRTVASGAGSTSGAGTGLLWGLGGLLLLGVVVASTDSRQGVRDGK